MASKYLLSSLGGLFEDLELVAIVNIANLCELLQPGQQNREFSFIGSTDSIRTFEIISVYDNMDSLYSYDKRSDSF